MFLKKAVIGAVISLLTCGWLFFAGRPDGLLHVYFLNVGQGDSIFLRTPAGHNILVDGGPKKNVLPELAKALPYFDNTIDLVVLTHPDRDHIEGLIYVMQKYCVSQIVFMSGAKNDFLYEKFLQIAQAKQISVQLADNDSDFGWSDGVFIDVLFPFEPIASAASSFPNASVAAKVIYGQNSILLASDAEEYEEKQLISSMVNLKSNILKVSHHGSGTGTSEKFLRLVNPEYAVISAGKNNSYGHPHTVVLDRLKTAGAKILRTDELGAIEFVMDKEKILRINSDNISSKPP